MDPRPATIAQPPSVPLWRGRRFWPLFVTQFLGAFNDNLLKNALVVLITYRLAVDNGLDAGPLVTLAAGIFILPFCLLSATAGQLADKIDRARIARGVKLAEMAIFLFALAGFALSHIALLMVALFLLGVHSAFFGPVKYAVLPQYLRPEELLAGNAYIGGATFVSILLGTIAGGMLVLEQGGTVLVSLTGLALAFAGYLASRRMPLAPPSGQDVRVNPNIIAATAESLSYVLRDRAIRRQCLTISWFWFVGATYLAQLPVFCLHILHADQTMVTLMLTLFSVGIGAGAVLAKTGVRWHLFRSGTVWTAALALGMAVFGLHMADTAAVFAAAEKENLLTARDFLQNPDGKWLLSSLFFLAVCGGAYVVPLYTALQRAADPAHIARTIGGLNILNAVFMVLSALVALAVMATGGNVGGIFLMVAIGNALVGAMALRVLPPPLPPVIKDAP